MNMSNYCNLHPMIIAAWKPLPISDGKMWAAPLSCFVPRKMLSGQGRMQEWVKICSEREPHH